MRGRELYPGLSTTYSTTFTGQFISKVSHASLNFVGISVEKKSNLVPWQYGGECGVSYQSLLL